MALVLPCSGEVIGSLRDLQSLSVDTSVEKEKQKAEVKHILQQKQRALSDLFKMLAEIGESLIILEGRKGETQWLGCQTLLNLSPCRPGLSYRKGLTWNRTADPENTLCMTPLEMNTALAAVRNPEPTESL